MINAQNQEVYITLRNFYLRFKHSVATGLYAHDESDIMPVIGMLWREDLSEIKSNYQVLHHGAITSLIDVAGIITVAAHISKLDILATLDLRIDYLNNCKIYDKRDLLVKAESCILDNEIAHVKSKCFFKDTNDIYALGTATYVLTELSEEEQRKLKDEFYI